MIVFYCDLWILSSQEPNSSQWFKFSDELVERIEGKNLKVGSENDIMPVGKGKKGAAAANGNAKVPKGFQVKSRQC